MPDDTYRRLIELLDGAGADYQLIDHPAEGNTERVSALRGHPAAHAAKALVLIVKVDRRTSRYVLAVVPGDRRADLAALRALYAARYVGFADAATAQRLARTVPGTVLPFSFEPELEVVADVGIEVASHLYFNAARLDRSVALRTADYLRIAQPRMAAIAASAPAEAGGGSG